MSQLIDRLNQITKTVVQPMGFRTVQMLSVELKMQLIANITDEHVDSLVDYIHGADVGLLTIRKVGSAAKTIERIFEKTFEIPWGLRVEDNTQEKMEQLTRHGCDFVVYPVNRTMQSISEEDKVGKILQVEASLSDGLLKTVNELPVDALLIAFEQEEDQQLTWHHLMLFQRFATLLTKPLIVPTSSKITGNEIRILWDMGVSGVVVETGTRKAAEELKRLRNVIDGLTFPALRKRENGKAELPHDRRETGTVAKIEDEEVD